MKFKSFLLIYIVISSCTSDHITNSLMIIDPPSFVGNEFKLSEISDAINYIPLDNKFPIGIIYSVKFTGNSVFLSAKDLGVIRFNREGKEPQIYGAVGRGPEEYVSCISYAVNNKTDAVYVMDRNNVIKVFANNGRYLKDINLPKSKSGFCFDNIEWFNSYLFVSQNISMCHAEYNWIILDTLGTIINRKRNSIPEFQGREGAGGGTYTFSDKIFYWNWYNDTVFSVSENFDYKAAYLFASGKHRFPAKALPFVSLMQYENLVSKYMVPMRLFETNRYIVFQYYYYLNKSAISFIEKNSGIVFLFFNENYATVGIGNDLDNGLDFQPIGYFVEKDREFLFGLLSPYQIKAHVGTETFINSSPKHPEKKKELEKLANSLKETDNPVLMLVRLKQ